MSRHVPLCQYFVVQQKKQFSDIKLLIIRSVDSLEQSYHDFGKEKHCFYVFHVCLFFFSWRIISEVPSTSISLESRQTANHRQNFATLIKTIQIDNEEERRKCMFLILGCVPYQGLSVVSAVAVYTNQSENIFYRTVRYKSKKSCKTSAKQACDK